MRLRQGEAPEASKNHNLGDYIVDGIPPGPKGSQRVEVKLKINENGILKVTTKRLNDGVEMDMEIDPKRLGGLTEEMVAEMK